MASNLRRADDLERIKLRHLVFQNDDGTRPAPYTVAVMNPDNTGEGEVTWSSSIRATEIMVNNPCGESFPACANTNTMRFTTAASGCYIEGGSAPIGGSAAPIYFTTYEYEGITPTLTVDIPTNKVGVNYPVGTALGAALDVNGSIKGSNLTLSGGITAASLNLSGGITCGGGITCAGTSIFTGNVRFTGDVEFDGEVIDANTIQPLVTADLKAGMIATKTLIAGTTANYADTGYVLDIRGDTKTTGNIQLPTGVAQGAPSLTFINDTNTGIFQSAAEFVSIASAGISKMTVSSGGVNIDSGNLSFSGSSSISLGTGGITMPSGNLSMTSGNVTLTNGSINLTNGNLTVGGTFTSRVATAFASTGFNISSYYGQYVFITQTVTVTLDNVPAPGTVVVLINTTANNISISGTLLGVNFAIPPNAARTLLSNGSNWYGL